MPDNNGKTYWIRWLVGIMWGALVMILMLIGNNVIANEKASRARDDKQVARIQELERQYTRIDTKLGYIDEGMREQKIVNEKILEKLDKLHT